MEQARENKRLDQIQHDPVRQKACSIGLATYNCCAGARADSPNSFPTPLAKSFHLNPRRFHGRKAALQPQTQNPFATGLPLSSNPKNLSSKPPMTKSKPWAVAPNPEAKKPKPNLDPKPQNSRPETLNHQRRLNASDTAPGSSGWKTMA